MAKSKTPATQALRDHLKQTGNDHRTMTAEQKSTYVDLSNQAMREQNDQTTQAK